VVRTASDPARLATAVRTSRCMIGEGFCWYGKYIYGIGIAASSGPSSLILLATPTTVSGRFAENGSQNASVGGNSGRMCFAERIFSWPETLGETVADDHDAVSHRNRDWRTYGCSESGHPGCENNPG